MEVWFDPLYTMSPPRLAGLIPALVGTLGRMTATSTPYRSPARMTSLFALVSTQLVNNCVLYVREGVAKAAAAAAASSGGIRGQHSGVDDAAAGAVRLHSFLERIPTARSSHPFRHVKLAALSTMSSATNRVLAAAGAHPAQHAAGNGAHAALLKAAGLASMLLNGTGITDGGRLWACPKHILAQRCLECVHVLAAYKRAFKRVQASVQTALLIGHASNTRLLRFQTEGAGRDADWAPVSL